MAGCEEEFEKIYIRYFNDVFLFLKKLSKDEGLAEEITSETFFKAMRSIILIALGIVFVLIAIYLGWPK